MIAETSILRRPIAWVNRWKPVPTTAHRIARQVAVRAVISLAVASGASYLIQALLTDNGATADAGSSPARWIEAANAFLLWVAAIASGLTVTGVVLLEIYAQIAGVAPRQPPDEQM